MRCDLTYRTLLCMVCCLMMAAMLPSCGTFEPEFPPVQQAHTDYPVHLDVSQEGMTKITADGNVLNWEETDQIQIAAVMNGVVVSDTAATSILKWYAPIGSDPSKASFTGFITLRSAPHTCYFTYPVGESMTVDAVSGTVKVNYALQDGLHEPLMYGKAAYDPDGMNVSMKHVGAVLELTVETEGVTKVSFVGNKLESLSPITINPDSGKVELSGEAVRQITVDVQKNGKTYLFVPPVYFEKGFTLVCSNDDGSRYFMKSYSEGSGKVGYDFSEKRGVRIPVKISGEFQEFAVYASDLDIYHGTNTKGLLTGTVATFKMHKSGTTDKLIEGWGANLADSTGNIVRSFHSEGPVTEAVCTMSVVNNATFLTEGEYTLTPYYIMYGKRKSFDKAVLPEKTIGNPGIVLTINGATSYNKFIDNNDDTDPNKHTNTLLEGLSVSINVDENIISNYSAALVGNDGNSVSIGNPSRSDNDNKNIRSYVNNITCTKWQAYTMTVSLSAGNISVAADSVFHITGLPYEADFRNTNPADWVPGWTFIKELRYNKPRVQFTGDGAVRSPAFHIPETKGINIKTSIDACLAATVESNRRMYIKTCSSVESSADYSGDYADCHYKVTHESNGFKDCSKVFNLTPDKPAMLYSKKQPGAYNTSLYQVKIMYSK